MSWVKLDDGYDEHPKVQLAGEEAAWMFVRGLLYCNRQKTLGFIPEGKVASLTTKPHWRKLAQTLVTCGERLGEPGLWEKVADGYVVVNYAKYQLTSDEDKKQANARTERLRELGRRGGQATQKRAPHVSRNLRRTKHGPEAYSEADSEATSEAGTEAPQEAQAEASRFDKSRSDARSGVGSAARSPDPVPVPESAHTGARDAQVGAHGGGGAAQAPASAPPPTPQETIEERWARVADVGGFSFPGILDLRREVEASAAKLGRPFDEVFDAAVAAFKSWRETCDVTKRPALSPLAMVRNWAHVYLLLIPKPASSPSDGGGSVVPSAEETARRLAERAARARAAGPVGAAALEALRQQEKATA